jgi:hypothetical protein
MVICNGTLKHPFTYPPLPLWLPQIPHGVHWPVTALARLQPLSDAVTEVHNSHNKIHVLDCDLLQLGHYKFAVS